MIGTSDQPIEKEPASPFAIQFTNHENVIWRFWHLREKSSVSDMTLWCHILITLGWNWSKLLKDVTHWALIPFAKIEGASTYLISYRAQTNLTVTGKKALNFCRNYGSFRVISLKTTFSRIEERFKLLENTWFVTLIPFQGGVFKVYHVDFKQKHINGAVWSNMYYLTILTVFVIALRRNYSSPDQMVGKNLSPFAPRLLTYYKFIVATPII